VELCNFVATALREAEEKDFAFSVGSSGVVALFIGGQHIIEGSPQDIYHYLLGYARAAGVNLVTR
jgi:hypothetical protein